MDRDSVLSSKGPPDRKVREVREGVEKEDWIYGLPPHVLYVTFDGDTVSNVKQYYRSSVDFISEKMPGEGFRRFSGNAFRK
jgi:hypothetical protein